MLNINLHPNLVVSKHFFGNESAPLLVIDNFIADPEILVNYAASLKFLPMGRSFPGVRVAAPLAYQQFFIAQIRPFLEEHFALGSRQLKLSMCHYSLVTTPPNQLALIQRIPHFDSVESSGLAGVHYLFKKSLGGTAFYRHRKTGFESIDDSRRYAYFESLEKENDGTDIPRSGYINGDTALFEQIAKHEGIFNRMLIYRRNSLHSGCIDRDFIPDPNPETGRLSINSFIDVG